MDRFCLTFRIGRAIISCRPQLKGRQNAYRNVRTRFHHGVNCYYQFSPWHHRSPSERDRREEVTTNRPQADQIGKLGACRGGFLMVIFLILPQFLKQLFHLPSSAEEGLGEVGLSLFFPI